MALIVVAVRDRATDAFMHPMCVHTIGQAVRSFGDEVNRADERNPLYRHPEDHDLFELGSFDERSGRVAPLADGPRQIAIGKDLVTKGG